MSNQHFDVVVIGGGPAGYASALYGASAGLSIALVEKARIGGTCLNVGCIPAKELLETASVARTVGHAAAFGIDTTPLELKWATTMERKQVIIDKLVGGLTGLLKNRKVNVFDGVGRLDGDHRTVRIYGGSSGDHSITGDAVILAAGSVPRTLDGFPVDDRRIVTSDELLSISELPESAAVIGGGAIGCEFASMMSDLGTEVTILEYEPKILPGCDADATKVVRRSFKKRGIAIRTGVVVKSQQTTDEGVTLTFGDDDEQLTVETVVISVGRSPASDTLGLDQTAVQVERGFITVDEHCRTTAPGVWAVGDVIATAQLAHIGFAEGMLAITDILGEDPHPIDYDKVPWCIYCHPEVAFVGHSEESAREAGFDVVVSKHRYAGNGRAMIVGETDGLVKIIAEKNPDGTAGKLLGVHMVGPWVTEQLGQGYLAVNWEATVEEVAQFIQPHPTMSELFGESVLALTGRSLHG
ncbi:MAG: dihydrolipoyl dehydrogenase [Actinomycetia bacterium]|nr:dihydrolipoyl dehydrogenase [Actinomycetes bacterium]MCP5032592.1 dihydrolipoyl dehydrogenase [Actinomycetes bacterium]